MPLDPMQPGYMSVDISRHRYIVNGRGTVGYEWVATSPGGIRRRGVARHRDVAEMLAASWASLGTIGPAARDTHTREG